MLFVIFSAAEAAIVTYWLFEKGESEPGPITIDLASQPSVNDGTTVFNITRVPGLAGVSALCFGNTNPSFVGAGTGVSDLFDTTSGISLAAIIAPTWSEVEGHYDQIFRNEDGGNRYWSSSQNDAFNGSASRADDPGGALGANDDVLRGGRFRRVVATYDANTADELIYVNGSLRWSRTSASGGIASGGAAAFIGIGVYSGELDENDIWGQPLSQWEIDQHVANELAENDYVVPEPTFVALPRWAHV